VEKCIESFGVDKSEVVLIGDSHFDAIGAKGANIDFIGVTYGFGFKTKSEVAEFENVIAVDTVGELLQEFEKSLN
jgi:phosphoglycolate phosphatase